MALAVDARADKATWQRVNPMNDEFPDPPVWWNECEGCKRKIAATEPIAIEMMFGALPNAVYCLDCADEEAS